MQRLVTVLALVLNACGGDALIGAWRSSDPGQFASQVDAVSQLITFSAGNKVASQGRVTYKATLPNLPGCQESTTATGVYALSGAGADQNVVFTYASGTVVRENCKNASDNLASRAYSSDELAVANKSGGKIVISGNTFTLTDTLDGVSASYTFTKQ